MKRLCIKFIHYIEFLALLYYLKAGGYLRKFGRILFVIKSLIKAIPNTLIALLRVAFLRYVGKEAKSKEVWKDLKDAYIEYFKVVKENV